METLLKSYHLMIHQKNKKKLKETSSFFMYIYKITKTKKEKKV